MEGNDAGFGAGRLTRRWSCPCILDGVRRVQSEFPAVQGERSSFQCEATIETAPRAALLTCTWRLGLAPACIIPFSQFTAHRRRHSLHICIPSYHCHHFLYITPTRVTIRLDQTTAAMSGPRTFTHKRTPSHQRNLDTAVHHANLIEQRKRVELDILRAVMELLDFPTDPHADSTRPAAADAHRFRNAVVPFQPADYDALIEERNIAGRCGYALCPKPKGKAPSTARKQFVETSRGVEIVDRKKLEVWCSDDCAKRALYVKVQLNEEPAWLRQGSYGSELELMVDNVEEHRMALPLRLKKAPQPPPRDTEEEDMAAAWAARDDALADLAIERGEKPGRLSKANKDLIQEKIKERVAKFPPVPPSLPLQSSGQSHMAIEGHVPKAERTRDDDDDDNDDQDWDKHLPG